MFEEGTLYYQDASGSKNRVSEWIDLDLETRRTWRYSCSWAGFSRSTFNAVLSGPGDIVIDVRWVGWFGWWESEYSLVCSREQPTRGGCTGFMHGWPPGVRARGNGGVELPQPEVSTRMTLGGASGVSWEGREGGARERVPPIHTYTYIPILTPPAHNNIHTHNTTHCTTNCPSEHYQIHPECDAHPPETLIDMCQKNGGLSLSPVCLSAGADTERKGKKESRRPLRRRGQTRQDKAMDREGEETRGDEKREKRRGVAYRLSLLSRTGPGRGLPR